MCPPEEARRIEALAHHHAPAGILSFDDDQIIRHANEQLHGWLKLAPGALAGSPLGQVLAPATRVFHSTHVFPLLKLRGRIDEIHLVLRDAAGGDVPVLASAIRDTTGSPYGPLTHCAFMTMAQRKEFEAALVQAREAAEAATVAKDEFLAIVSHELRTPLNAITGWISLARSGKLDDAMQRRALETIERNAQCQAQLIEDLLDVSRIVSGKLRISARPIELGSIVESAVDTARPSAAAKSLGLIVSIDREAGIVHADPSRVQQIVWNLLSNAVKFTQPQGEVVVTLSRAEGAVRLDVADTGIGIEQAKLPYVFDRFWQGAPALAREHTGLGLGLSICRSLVELHGGTIRVNSAGAGMGSLFTVEFPLAPADTDRRVGRPSLPASEPADASALDGLHVLVVDDDPEACSLLKMLFETAGARVETADSADSALRCIRRKPPQVLVSDIGMPGKDGLTLIRELRADPSLDQRALAAIAVTGMTRPNDRVNMLRAGFQAHLVKPVEPEEIIALVGALGRSHGRTRA